MDIKAISLENRELINKFISSHWFTTDMVVRNTIYDMTEMDGFVVYDNDIIIGLVTYRIEDDECEIMSLDSLREKQGIGTILIDEVKKTAIKTRCKRLKLIATNDNINALKFYQKRGFDMTGFYYNAVNKARKLKPSIPLIGEFNIPIKHEIEFEINFL